MGLIALISFGIVYWMKKGYSLVIVVVGAVLGYVLNFI